MSKWLGEKKIVLEAAQKMLEKGLVVGTAGNVSLRLPPEGDRKILAITPSSRHYDLLSVADIQVIDFEAKPVEGNLPPSVETTLHIGIYQARRKHQCHNSHPLGLCQRRLGGRPGYSGYPG